MNHLFLSYFDSLDYFKDWSVVSLFKHNYFYAFVPLFIDANSRSCKQRSLIIVLFNTHDHSCQLRVDKENVLVHTVLPLP
jgi:hypothetical protein